MPKIEGACRFSIVIPCYNDPEGVSSCLRAIYQQEGCHSFEVIVIDDCSDMDIAAKVSPQYPKVIFERLSKNSGPGAARNRGIALARGQYIAFIDSDAVPSFSWLSSLATEFGMGTEIICGPVRHSSGILARLTALTAFGEYQDSQDGFRKHCPSVNYAIVAKIMNSFSYDETIPFAGEDVILSTQLTSAGYPIRYLASAWVLHNPSLSCKQYFKRAFAYGLGFKCSRARCRDLAGYSFHKYLRAASAIILFFIRVGLDCVRLVKLRKELAVRLVELPSFVAGIILTRVVYSVGVAWGYFV